MKALLQGRPIRHPLHTILIHFPLALFPLSLLLDVAALLTDGGPALVRGAFYAMAGGVATALIAAVPGFVDYLDIRPDRPARRTATWHMLLNLTAVGLYAVNLSMRTGHVTEAQPPTVPVVLSLAGIGLLAISGWLGGALVYEQGIGVGRHRRTAPQLPATARAAAATDGEPVRVAALRDLAERSVLRAEVGGTVVVLAYTGGRLCAFQEFCTHRYGPLSEGCLHDGQVECPWHRSRFDVRSGEIVQGPAKEPLRTFEVTVRGDDVFVRVPREAGAAREAG